MKLKLHLTVLFIIYSCFSFAQTWQWGRQTISTLTNCLSSDVDNVGNVWIAGNYGNGTSNLSGNILPAPPPNFSANIFIGHYDINGNLLLAKYFSGSLGDVNVYSIKTDINNNIYVAGNFLGTLYLDTINLITGTSPSTFVFKADNSGIVIWAKKLPYVDANTYTGILDLDSFNNIIIAGTYQYPGGGGLHNCFIEKLDNSGNSLSQYVITGQNNNLTWNPLFVSPSGSYFLIGGFEGSATLNSTIINPVGAYDIFIAKFSSTDSLEWFRNYGTTGIDNPGAIVSDDNNIYFISGDKINMLNAQGDSVWNNVIGNPSNINLYGQSMVIRNKKPIIAGSYFNTQISIGTTTFPFATNSNLFLAQVDSAGSYDWGIIATSTGSLSPFSLTHFNNNVYVNGNFGSPTGHSTLAIANDTLISNNLAHAEGYLAKLEVPTTGITSVDNSSSKIIVAPNPNDGNFSIAFSNFINKGVIEIYNLFGENVFKENINSSMTKEINLKNISAGIYFAKVYDGNNVYCKKLIVERN